MDIYNEIRRILKELEEDVDVIEFENNRKKLPEIGFRPKVGNGKSVLLLRFNRPALMRLALWEILIHEMTHKKLYEDGYENWKEHDDVFWKKYSELRKIYENKVAKMYGR